MSAREVSVTPESAPEGSAQARPSRRHDPLELEICAETPQACDAAREGGADRIELCSALSEGGLTPSHGLIRAAMRRSGLPVHVLLRPRAGDFVYSEAEYETMREDLRHAAELGAAGVVLGILRRDGSVDRERTGAMVALAAPLPVTFHRAFDRSSDLPEALETIIGCGCARLLSSGGETTATEGAAMLGKLTRQAAGRLRIAAGGGIRLGTAAALIGQARVDLHASLRTGNRAARATPARDPLWNSPEGGPNAAAPVFVEDVRQLAALLRQLSVAGLGS